MTADQLRAAANVINGLNSKGQNRLEEAEEYANAEAAKGNTAPLAGLAIIRQQIEEYDVEATGCCPECDSWDGLDRRCCCGNRRIAWSWDARHGWTPETY